MTDNTIYSFKKNSFEEIRFSVSTFKEKEFVDVRVFVQKKDDSGEMVPTKKGITFSTELIEEFCIGAQNVRLALENQEREKEAVI